MQTKISLFALTLLLVPTLTQAADKKKALTPAKKSTEAAKEDTKKTDTETTTPSGSTWATWVPKAFRGDALYQLQNNTFDSYNPDEFEASRVLEKAVKGYIAANDQQSIETFFKHTLGEGRQLSPLIYKHGLQYMQAQQAAQIAASTAALTAQLATLHATNADQNKKIKDNKKMLSLIKKAGFAAYSKQEELDPKNDSDDEGYDTAYILRKKVIPNESESTKDSLTTLLSTEKPASKTPILSSSCSPSSSASTNSPASLAAEEEGKRPEPENNKNSSK